MGRPAKFSNEQILDTTARIVAEVGPSRTTMATIAERMGAPTGSIYHRFESRELLLARLWVRTAERAQQGFLDALADDSVEAAAINAALHIPRWARANVDDARVMLLYRRQELAEQWPAELGPDLARLGDTIDAAVRTFARRYFGRATRSALETTHLALLDIPYAAVRRYLLSGKAPPASLDRLVAKAAGCVLATGSSGSVVL